MDSGQVNTPATARRSLSSQSEPVIHVVKTGNLPVSDASGSDNNKSKTVDQEAILLSSANRLKTHVQSIQRDIQFSIDKESGDVVITVLDSQTKKVIRQIPSEEILALARNIESMKGILFSAEV